MITQLLPTGLIGILIAALLSGLMSQVSGALNSISTMVSYGVCKRYRPQIPDDRLIRIGKISAGIALIFSLCLLPLLNRYESIFKGLNDIIAHIAPPITCVFVVGVFWKKASATSAKLTLWIGSFRGGLVFTLTKLYPETLLGRIPFMMMGFYLFCICVLMQVTFSYLYPAAAVQTGDRLYWRSLKEPLESKGWSGIGNYKVLSFILLLIMIILFYVFR